MIIILKYYHHKNNKNNYNNVLNYIILDDTQLDKNNTQYANWIQTDSYVGLTKDHIKLIDKIWR